MKHIKTDKDLQKLPSQGKLTQMGGHEEFGELLFFVDRDEGELIYKVNRWLNNLARDENNIRKIEYERFFFQGNEYHYIIRVKIGAHFLPEQPTMEQTEVDTE